MSPKEPRKRMETARTLAEALPYMRKFAGQTFVIKFGGHAMGDEALQRNPTKLPARFASSTI